MAILLFHFLSLALSCKIFTKAGYDCWRSFIPIYSLYYVLKIINKPGKRLWLMLIPLGTLVVPLVLTYKLCLCFGRSKGFATLALFLPIICLPIIAFSDDKYSVPEVGL
ncbi:MAG: DUF5684 domain-containing protein [Bacteroidales bacterium]|nr:DUF5684 domain-containing protein [Bacteroidales bacterium]MDD4673068.1 DUF5684 domain-containing protein [Bacteroidales bacterium]MDY0349335.1 DUF5684 domain-containing protein [Tenuifilaceae bacterium]